MGRWRLSPRHDLTIFERDRLARCHTQDAGNQGSSSRSVLQLQEFRPELGSNLGHKKTRPHEGLRFGRKGKVRLTFDIVERLDTERITRQAQPARQRLVDRKGVHATKWLGEVLGVLFEK